MSHHWKFDATGFGTGDERIPWADVAAVAIRTTPDGPWFDDVFWQFVVANDVYELPGSLVGGDDLGVMQQQLAGIDSYAIIEAMGSTTERTFSIWRAHRAWDRQTLRGRFLALVERLGGSISAAAEVFEALYARWNDASRHYHDVRHLTECLRELDSCEPSREDQDRIELALWYHDAVYDPRSRTNEDDSAELLIADVAVLAISDQVAQHAAALVRATAIGSSAPELGAAGAIMRDIDLSILGRDALRFMEYELDVEREYRAVSTRVFRLARGRLLASLLAAPQIFHAEPLRARYEAIARINIVELLASPRYRVYRWLRWLPSFRTQSRTR
ncbi:MAG: hypothetical protein AB7L28_25610 [Kofleriaceae bacterium]